MKVKEILKNVLTCVLATSIVISGLPTYAQAREKATDSDLPSAAFQWDFEDVRDGDAGSGAALKGAAEVVEDADRGSKVLSLPGGPAGSGYLELPESLFSGVGADGFTVSMWVRPDSAVSQPYRKVFDASNAKLGETYGGSGESWWNDPEFGLAVGGGDFDLALYVGEAGKSTDTKTKLKYEKHLENDRWNYLSVSVSPTDCSIYMDGEKISYEDRQGWTGTVQEALEALFEGDYVKTMKYAAIGRCYYTSDDDFKGKVDNVSFYNVALTEAQERVAYEEQCTQPAQPSAAFQWDFEDVRDGDAGSGAVLKGGAEVVEDADRGSKVLSLPGGPAGSGYLELPESLFSEVGAEGFTVSMWVRPDSAVSQPYRKVFDASNAKLGGTYSGENWWNDPEFGLAVGGGDFDLALYVGEAGKSTDTKTKLKYEKHLENDRWNYLSVSVSPTDCSIYMDGEKISYEDRQGWTGTVQEALEALFEGDYVKTMKYAAIGRCYYTSDDDFKGKVDNVSFYNVALTEAQEKAAYEKQIESVGDERDKLSEVVIGIANGESTSLKTGDTLTLSVKINPDELEGKAEIIWESDNEDIVSVDRKSGVVTAKKIGTAKITAVATYKGKSLRSNEIEITVDVIPVESVTIEGGDREMEIGETVSLSAIVFPGNATDREATWNTSAQEIVSVDESGMIVAKSAGTACITVSVADKTAFVTITVKEKEYTVTVINGAIQNDKREYRYREKATVIAQHTTEAGKFVGWQNSNGKYVCYAQKYTFEVIEDMSLTAVYSKEEIEKPVTVNCTAAFDKTQGKIMFIGERAIPVEICQGGKVKSHGIILSAKENIGTDLEAFQLGKTGVTNSAAKNTFGVLGVYTTTVKGTSGKKYYARSYVTYIEAKTGKEVTEYSEIISIVRP